MDLREKAIACLEKGHSMREARGAFSMGLGTVNEWRQKHKKTGGLKPKRHRFTFRKLDPEKLKPHAEARPDACLKETGRVFGCSGVAALKAFRRLKIARKKTTRFREQRPEQAVDTKSRSTG